VQDGAEEQVNLPHAMVKQIEHAIQRAAKGEAGVRHDVFDGAEKEIFALMDRNAMHRFKEDPDAVKAVCDEFFLKADATNDGVVSFGEYKAWVMHQPQIIAFFEQLSSSVLALLARSKSSSNFPNPSVMPRSQRRTSDRATAEELAKRATDMALAELTAKPQVDGSTKGNHAITQSRNQVDGSSKCAIGTSLKMHSVVVGGMGPP